MSSLAVAKRSLTEQTAFQEGAADDAAPNRRRSHLPTHDEIVQILLRAGHSQTGAAITGHDRLRSKQLLAGGSPPAVASSCSSASAVSAASFIKRTVTDQGKETPKVNKSLKVVFRVQIT